MTWGAVVFYSVVTGETSKKVVLTTSGRVLNDDFTLFASSLGRRSTLVSGRGSP